MYFAISIFAAILKWCNWPLPVFVPYLMYGEHLTLYLISIRILVMMI